MSRSQSGMTEDVQRLLGEIASTLQVDTDELTPDRSLDDLGWDSLASITFISQANDLLGKSISGEQIQACETIQDLLTLIS